MANETKTDRFNERGDGRYTGPRPDNTPRVPAGLKRKIGVEYGCGLRECQDCYEPLPERAQ
jgi:hypothetical protein